MIVKQPSLQIFYFGVDKNTAHIDVKKMLPFIKHHS